MAKSPEKSPKQPTRSARLAEALKANLKRRKAQARQRAEAQAAPQDHKNR